MFVGRGWFHTLNKCIEFSEELTQEVQLQWFIDIVAYLKFVTGDKFSPRESQIENMHASKVINTKEQSIVISYFKTDILPILGGFREVKDSTTPLTAIRTSELWSTNTGVRGVQPSSSIPLKYKYLKL